MLEAFAELIADKMVRNARVAHVMLIGREGCDNAYKRLAWLVDYQDKARQGDSCAIHYFCDCSERAIETEKLLSDFIEIATSWEYERKLA